MEGSRDLLRAVRCHPCVIFCVFSPSACPKWTFGAGCSEECHCVVKNTLECHRRHGTCACKPGYQGNTCKEGKHTVTMVINRSTFTAGLFYSEVYVRVFFLQMTDFIRTSLNKSVQKFVQKTQGSKQKVKTHILDVKEGAHQSTRSEVQPSPLAF